MEHSPTRNISQIQSAPPAAPALVVSLHDVHPGSQATIARILADLDQLNIRQTSLLIVPDWHGRFPLPRHPSFCHWLAELSRDHELVLHGYHHLDKSPSEKNNALDRIIATHYTAGEGEFFDADVANSVALLSAGLQVFRQLHLKTSGFIAPAWLLGPGAHAALRSFPEFHYTVTLRGVLDLHTHRFYPSQSLCYSSRTPWRRLCSLLWNEMLLASLADNPLIRLSLHPPDWDYPAIRNHALRCARIALQAARKPLSYSNWLAEQQKMEL